LGVGEGDRIVFFKSPKGYIIANSKEVALRNMRALRKAQAAFAGEAERLGLRTEEDVAAMIREYRADKRKNESNS
jgi:hypothetical protein